MKQTGKLDPDKIFYNSRDKKRNKINQEQFLINILNIELKRPSSIYFRLLTGQLRRMELKESNIRVKFFSVHFFKKLYFKTSTISR